MAIIMQWEFTESGFIGYDKNTFIAFDPETMKIRIHYQITDELLLETPMPLYDEHQLSAVDENYDEVFTIDLTYSHRLNLRALQDAIEEYVRGFQND